MAGFNAQNKGKFVQGAAVPRGGQSKKTFVANQNLQPGQQPVGPGKKVVIGNNTNAGATGRKDKM